MKTETVRNTNVGLRERVEPLDQLLFPFCTSVCLRMVLKYYDLYAPNMYWLHFLTRGYFNKAADYVRSRGLSVTHRYNGTVEVLAEYVNERNIPVIVAIKVPFDSHAVVVTAVAKRYVEVVDPSKFIFPTRRYSRRRFERLWGKEEYEYLAIERPQKRR